MHPSKPGFEPKNNHLRHLVSNSTLACAFVVASLGCDVESADNTPGIQLDGGPEGTCNRGVVVVNSDFASANISLLSLQGEVLSSSFISSASTTTGLSAPLSGDVAMPTTRLDGSSIVLIDRYPASVVTWVNLQSGTPSGQLSVATGFIANPRDYLQLSIEKAYVSRYESNLQAGKEPFDDGGDILIIDPTARTISGRIAMEPAMQGAADGFYPHPDKLLAVGSSVAVLLGAQTAYYDASLSSRIARVNPSNNAIEQTIVLEGMHDCSAMAQSPSGEEIAVACSGQFDVDLDNMIAESGIVLVSTKGNWEEKKRFPAATFGMGPVGGAVAYASERTVVFLTTGEFGGEVPARKEDALVVLDTDAGVFETVLRSDGMAYSLGDVRCDSACGVCFATDAQRSGGVLHRFEVSEDGFLGNRTQIVVDTVVGLPPRGLGWF